MKTRNPKPAGPGPVAPARPSAVSSLHPYAGPAITVILIAIGNVLPRDGGAVPLFAALLAAIAVSGWLGGRWSALASALFAVLFAGVEYFVLGSAVPRAPGATHPAVFALSAALIALASGARKPAAAPEAVAPAPVAQAAVDRSAGELALLRQTLKAAGVDVICSPCAPPDPALPEPIETLLSRVHPEDRGSLERQLRDVVEQCHELNVEYRVGQPDGQYRPIAAAASCRPDEGGGLLLCLAQVMQPRESGTHELVEALLKNQPTPLWILAPEGEVLFASRGALQTSPDCIGKRFGEVLPGEETRARLEVALGRARTGEAARLQHVPLAGTAGVSDLVVNPVNGARPPRFLLAWLRPAKA